MRKCFAIVMLLTAGLLVQSCASNPADNKAKATVAEASPEAEATKMAGAEILTITPSNSKVEFAASKVTRTHNGSFKQFGGAIDLANKAAEQSRVTIEIDTASVVTDDDGLTKHLQTPDFFDVAKYPKATFTSTRIEPSAAGGTHTITGNFSLHGVTKSISFPATIQIAADKVTVTADFSINRKDWGLVYPGKADDLIRDEVVIKLSLNVPRKP